MDLTGLGKPCIDCGTHTIGVRCDPCFEAQVVTPEGYTIAQLRRAFEDVANPEGWKLPICCAIAADERDLVARAIEHFTGSVARFAEIAGGLQVQAVGYYAAVGA